MLGDHLVPVSGRRREDVQHDVLDRVGQQTQLLGTAPSLDDIDANEWHGMCPSMVTERRGLVSAAPQCVNTGDRTHCATGR
jgi:hypothetical protein